MYRIVRTYDVIITQDRKYAIAWHEGRCEIYDVELRLVGQTNSWDFEFFTDCCVEVYHETTYKDCKYVITTPRDLSTHEDHSSSDDNSHFDHIELDIECLSHESALAICALDIVEGFNFTRIVSTPHTLHDLFKCSHLNDDITCMMQKCISALWCLSHIVPTDVNREIVLLMCIVFRIDDAYYAEITD